MNTALFDQTVTVTTMAAGTPDAYGDTQLEAGASTFYPGRIEPTTLRGENVEVLLNRDTVKTLLTLYLGPDAVITAADRVTDHDGLVYEVLAEPAKMPGFSGVDHIEAFIQRISG